MKLSWAERIEWNAMKVHWFTVRGSWRRTRWRPGGCARCRTAARPSAPIRRSSGASGPARAFRWRIHRLVGSHHYDLEYRGIHATRHRQPRQSKWASRVAASSFSIFLHRSVMALCETVRFSAAHSSRQDVTCIFHTRLGYVIRRTR